MDSPSEPITVLHVDDEAAFVETAAELLCAEDDRFRVITETRVEAALDRLDEDVDCVVSDYDMPRLDGLEFLQTVREREPDLPFVLFTGKGSEEVASKAISAGVTDYLQKDAGEGQYAVLANVIENAVTGHRAERALRRVRDRMGFALDTTDAVIYEFDAGTGAETRHGAFDRLFGLPSSEVRDLQRFYERAVHPDDRMKLRDRQEDVIDGLADSVELEYRTNPENGPVRWIRTAMARVPGDEGVRTNIIGLATDMTALKDREAELGRQVERLDEFTSIVSHDLRNPLSVSRGRIQLAEEALEDAEAPGALDDLERAMTALDRMETLIENLLTLARHGEAVGHAGPVELGPIAERCWQTVSTDQAVMDIDTAATIRADPSRLRQLLENLIRNAVEHAGPAVTIHVGDLEGGFFVEDDGPGIPPGDRERAFEHRYSTAPAGNGFGLAIVEGIAEAHGWTVAVSEGDAGGARIEFTGVERVDD